MKLSQVTTRYFLFFTSAIFFIGGFITHISIRSVVFSSIDHSLSEQREQIAGIIEQGKLGAYFRLGLNVHVETVDPIACSKDKFYFMHIAQPGDGGHVDDFRVMESCLKHKDSFYKIIIRQPVNVELDLINSLIPIQIYMFLGLIIGITLMNRSIYNRLWNPFFRILDSLRYFRPGIRKYRDYEDSIMIDEFAELDKIAAQLAGQVEQDFDNQRRFIENVSHELQTPLSVLQNRLHLLSQSNNMQKSDWEHIRIMNDTLKRTKTLNQSLVLLYKIENNRFDEKEYVNFVELIKNKIEELNFMAEAEGIRIDFNVNQELIKPFHPTLADVLVTNLLTNSFKYNVTEGKTLIVTYTNGFRISNTGKELDFDEKMIFNRHNKHTRADKPNSFGIGMNIVLAICEKHNCRLEYTFSKPWHIFDVMWDN